MAAVARIGEGIQTANVGNGDMDDCAVRTDPMNFLEATNGRFEMFHHIQGVNLVESAVGERPGVLI